MHGPIADILADRFTARGVNLLRFEAHERRAAVRLLRKLEAELVQQVQQFDPYAPSRTLYQQARLEALLQWSRTTIASRYRSLRDRQVADLESLAGDEAARTERTINGVVGADIVTVTVPETQLAQIVSGTLIEGSPAASWWGEQSKALQRRFTNQMQMGAIRGETVDELVRRVRGTRANGYTDGIMETSRREAQALVRTAIQGVSNGARMAVFRANDDVVRGVQALVTLDGRTTEICIARSGAAWDLEGAPLPESTRQEPFPGYPPWHFNALAKGARITTPRGEVAIESVRVGDLVLTHRGRFMPVYATMKKRNQCGVVRRLHTDSGRVLWATDEHPVLVRGRGWQRADQVEVGDECFQYAEHPMQASAGLASEVVANDRPPGFDESFVPDEVVLNPALVRHAIHFERDHVIDEGEVEHVPTDLMLVGDVNAGGGESVQEQLLAPGRRGAHAIGERAADALLHAGHCGGIVRAHALTVPTVHRVSLGATAEPMVVGAALHDGLTLGRATERADRVRLRAHGDAMALAPEAEPRLAPAEPSLNGPNTQSLLPVQVGDQIGDGLPIAQVECWHTVRIIAVDVVEYHDDVYNLGVADDETYVADGVIVHNCRTTLIAVLKSVREILGAGIGKRKAAALRALPKATQSSMDGQVAASLTYEQWLKTKPESFQRDVLGRGKWELWQAGGLTLSELIDQSGRPLSLEQLRQAA